MSQIYRAYHAIRDLSNKQGMATNAVYGFTTMLRRLIKEEAPGFLAVAMESRGPTFRHEQYQDYKANRPRMPDDLAEQIPYVLRVCEVMRIPVLSYERYEADDVIGTLARKARQDGCDVVVVTIDKDLLQLVDEGVAVLDPRTMTLLDAGGVEEKLGVTPNQVVDYLSLVGDASDNVPGAPGIGAKGAQKLIRQYGTLENLLKSAETVTRKTYRESLQQNAEQIRRSRELVTIHCDLEIPLDLDEFRLAEPDDQKAFELFTELGFKSLVEDFVKPVTRQEAQCAVLEDLAGLAALTDQLAGTIAAVAVDYPAADSAPNGLNGLAVSIRKGEAVYVPGELLAQHPQDADRLWASPRRWAIHDLKKLLLFCRRRGRRIALNALDTMLMGYLLDPNQRDFSLQTMAAEFLGQSLSGSGELFEQTGQQLADEASVELQLVDQQFRKIEELKLERLLIDIEVPVVHVLAAMEDVGVLVDIDFFRTMSQEIAGDLDGLSKRIYALAQGEFNINSPKQMAEVLFERLKLPIVKRTRKAGHYSTGVEVLEKLAADYEIAKLILEYRELSKLKGTYLDALPGLVDPATNRIHTSYNQMVAATGRLSSSNPNLQNIPIKSELGRRIRRGFIAEPGFRILSADYSQIELRVMAHLSQDPMLIEAFREGEDIHARTAREVFGMHAAMEPDRFRRHAKVINFGIMYGLSAFGLAQSLKIDRKEAKRFIEDYFRKYKGVESWIDETLRKARELGYVTTLFGRIRPIPELHSKNRNLRSFGERTAINAPIQGTAADLIKVAMVNIQREMEQGAMRSRMILQVHDELVFEVEDSEFETLQEMVPRLMEGVAEMDVPLKVDMASGPTWYDAK